MNELTQQIVIGVILIVAALYLFRFFKSKKDKKSACKQCPVFNASVDKENKSNEV